MSIFFNNSSINDWDFGTSNIVKVYHNNAVCYYKVVAGETAQTPCYAVVDDITQYQDTEFENVFNKADNKWYKLNNLNEYEEYGVYASGRTECSGVTPTDCVTTYEGKLTIDGDYEYQYSGNSWNNVGEISGSSRLPQGYTEVEYIENTTQAYINTGFKPNQDTRITCEMQCVSSTTSVLHFGTGGWDKVDGMWLTYESGINGTLHISWLGKTTWSTYSSVQGDYNKHTYDWDKNNIYKDNVLVASSTLSNYSCPDNLAIFTAILNGISYESSLKMLGRVYWFKIYDNGTLVRDFVPCINPSNVVGVYDVVNDVFYGSANNYNFVAGSAVTPSSTVYPLYYDEIQDPPTQVSFSSMTEAEQYECPYVGLMATINGDLYIFNDSYQWELIPTPSYKFQATYTGGTTSSAECDSTSAITNGEIATTDLESVVIGDCVTSIGYGAFSGCRGLTSINIPDSVTSISEYAFYLCTSLMSIAIPNSVTSIGDRTFFKCFGLSSVTIPNSVTSIGNYVFKFCRSLTSIDIPNGVTTIGAGAFSDCTGLTSVTIYAETPPTLVSGNAFVYTPIASGTGYIYVPSQSVEAYKTAWSDYASRIQAKP